MKLRTLLAAFILLVGISSVSTAGMNRQKRAGAAIAAAQPTSAQTCINEGTQVQRRNGQQGNMQGMRQRNGQGRNSQVGNGQGRNRQSNRQANRQGRNGQGNRQGRKGQGGNGKGRNGQGGKGQNQRGQGANNQECNCDGTCINQ